MGLCVVLCAMLGVIAASDPEGRGGAWMLGLSAASLACAAIGVMVAIA
jgi:hypothetical protein